MCIKRKIKMALLGGVGVTVATVANAAALTTMPVPVMSAPSAAPSWMIGVEGLYWRPENGHLQYVLLDDTSDDAVTTGKLKEVDPDGAFGFRVEAGCCFDGKTDVTLSYTEFNDKTSELVEPCTADLWAILSHHDGVSKADSRARASFKVDLDQIDLMVNRTINLSKWNLRFGGGLRYLPNLDSTLWVRYEDSERSYTDITKKSEFSGVGPRVSMSGVYNFVGNLGIVAEAGGSLIMGKIKVREIQDRINQASGGEVDVTKDDSDYNIIPEADVKLGLRYTQKFGGNWSMMVDAGWQAVKYFDVRHQMAFTGGWSVESGEVHSHDFHNRAITQVSNIGFDGPYVGLKVIL